MPSASVIVVGAGSGERLGRGEPKGFVEVGGRALIALAVEAALGCSDVAEVIAVVPAGSVVAARRVLGALGVTDVVVGGPTRHASVAAALERSERLPDRIVIHDAARPFASPALFAAVIRGLERWAGVVPGLPVTDTVKRISGEEVTRTEPRDELVLAQTPQAFRRVALLEAHERAVRSGLTFGDDAACLEWAGYTVGVVAGEESNFKITTPDDLRRAEAVMERATR